MQSPTTEEFARLSAEVKRTGNMVTQLIELVGTLGAEVRDGFRDQRAEMHAIQDELRGEMHAIRDELRGDMHAIRDELRGEIDLAKTELKADIETLRHDSKSERRARGQWQADTEHRISSLELRFEGEANA